MCAVVDTDTLHRFSQLVYLDAEPVQKAGEAPVEDLIRYYLESPVGMARMKARFGQCGREYDCWLPFLQECGECLQGWYIGGILNDNDPRSSGFYGYTARGPTGEMVVAFRGSETFGDPRYRNDYAADVALAYERVTPQQRMVDAYWRRCPPSGQFCITGHSLGGNLAAYGAITAPEEFRRYLQRCVVFNAPGFNLEFLAGYRREVELAREKLTHYANEFDPVSSLLKQPAPPVIVQSLYDPASRELADPLNLVYPHSNFMYLRGENREFVQREDGGKSQFCRQLQEVSARVMELPRPLRRDLADSLLAAVYHRAGPRPTGRVLLESVIRAIPRGSYPDALDFASMAYAARLAASAGDGTLYERAGKAQVGSGQALLLGLQLLGAR